MISHFGIRLPQAHRDAVRLACDSILGEDCWDVSGMFSEGSTMWDAVIWDCAQDEVEKIASVIRERGCCVMVIRVDFDEITEEELGLSIID